MYLNNDLSWISEISRDSSSEQCHLDNSCARDSACDWEGYKSSPSVIQLTEI